MRDEKDAWLCRAGYNTFLKHLTKSFFLRLTL